MKSRTIRNFCAAAVFSGCLIALPAHAERVQKFGYVNPERVYTETQAAQRIEATLQQEFGAQQQKLNALQQQGIKLRKQLTHGKLSNAARKQTEAKLLETGKQYRMASARLAEEYNLRRNEEFAALQRKANEIIFNIIETEHYDAMLSEVIFIRGEFDITDRVIKLLDAEMQ